MKLPIGIDASRSFVDKPTGTENYSYQITKSIASIDRQLPVKLYCRGNAYEKHQNEFPNTEFIPIKTRFAWTQAGLMQKTWQDKLSVLFIPAHVIPILKNPQVPIVITTHDIRTEFLPQHSNLLQKIYLNTFVERLRAQMASHLIAVSQATKNDLVEQLGADPKKISVIYEGIDHQHYDFHKSQDQQKLQEIKQKYQIAKPFFLFVGSIQPRKNLVRLMQAFAQVQKQLDMDLLLVGKKGWMADEIYETPGKLRLTDRIRFLNYVEFSELPYLYSLATAFAFPSLYEGFGLPILEAFAMGTRVVTSRISSMPEVGGKYAIYVDPHNVDSIAQGLLSAISQEVASSDLINYSHSFNWQDAGEQTWQVLTSVANQYE